MGLGEALRLSNGGTALHLFSTLCQRQGCVGENVDTTLEQQPAVLEESMTNRSRLTLTGVLATFSFIGAGLHVAPAGAQSCPELLGQWPCGPTMDVVVSSGFAYFGNGFGLKIADVSNPASPVIVGEVPFPGRVRSVAISAGHVLVGETSGYLHMLDVSTPSIPVEVGSVFATGPEDIFVSGGFAFVADLLAGGLRVFDVSLPSAPVEVAFCQVTGDQSAAVDVAGGYAFVAGHSTRLTTFDVSTPSTPFEVGSLNLSTAVLSDVAVSDGFAYTGAFDPIVEEWGVLVIDVSTPSAPVEVGMFPGGGLAVSVSDGYLFSTDRTGLQVFDLSTPSAPVPIGSVGLDYQFLASNGSQIFVSDSHAFVAAYGGGLKVIDASTPSSPAEVGSVDSRIESSNVASFGDVAYVATAVGLSVIELGLPSEPHEVGSFFHHSFRDSGNVVRSDNLVLWLRADDDYRGRVDILDVSAPAAPVQVSSFLTGEFFNWRDALAVSDDHAFVEVQNDLVIFDISTPSVPVYKGVWDGGDQTLVDLAVSGGYAYVATVSWGESHEAAGFLRVLNVSTPSSPVEVGFFAKGDQVEGVAVSGDFAFLTGESFSVIDVSAPSTPIEVGFLDISSGDVAVMGSQAYVLSDNVVRVLDVSTPFAPVEVGLHQAQWAENVSASNDRVYVNRPAGGMWIFNGCQHGQPSCAARRTLPECFRANQENTVSITIDPGSAQSWTVEETPPPTWSVTNISHGGQVDASSHKVTWGPFGGNQARNLTYDATPPTEPLSVDFSGSLSLDGVTQTVCGDVRIPGGVCSDVIFVDGFESGDASAWDVGAVRSASSAGFCSSRSISQD